MPKTIGEIVNSATKEWDHWGKSTWHVPKGLTRIAHTDNEEAFSSYVLRAYCSVGGGRPPLVDIQDDRYYWSAVGMSAIMKGAGFQRQEFPFAQSHSVYIRRFVQARMANDLSSAFWAFRAGENGGQPEVGDLVAYARGEKMNSAKAARLFDSTTRYDSHSDVVVEKRASEIDVIGANVLDSVTKKTLSIDANGHIQDGHHNWFAVLKRRNV